MKSQTFRPSGKYVTKLMLNVTLLAVAAVIGCLLFAWLISIDEGARTGSVVATISVVIVAVCWVVAVLLVGPYYRSLSYEIQNDEVIVRVGILVKSVKHVPYRTVTNITTKRDIFDRWFFGLGTLNIQTAGMSGAKGAEERLVGLPNVQDVYEMVATELRRFRGAMSPTAADLDQARADDAPDGSEILSAILEEVRAIRRAKAG
jgi:uncharacterized membrane protein YdbT with pleckstrin-like domain